MHATRAKMFASTVWEIVYLDVYRRIAIDFAHRDGKFDIAS